jgi:sRNA-binding protein
MGAVASVLTNAGPLPKDDVICGDALGIAHNQTKPQARDWRKDHDAALQTISALAELFPNCFVADRWKPHRPLARGIHRELIERGILQPRECSLVLRLYVGRLMYQHALAAGGVRINLGGLPVGEVAADEIKQAEAAIARSEAKAAARAQSARGARQAAYAERVQQKPAPAPAPPANMKRDGLAALKAAAAARRNGGAP